MRSPPHLPQWRPLSELNNIDSPYQELRTLSRRTPPAVVIFVPLVAYGRPLNKNAREEEKKKARADAKSDEEGTRIWWKKKKNRIFDRWYLIKDIKRRSWTSPCCGRIFSIPSAAWRVKSTVTFIAHIGRKKIPSMRFSVRYIYTPRRALIFIPRWRLRYHKFRYPCDIKLLYHNTLRRYY